MEKILIKKTFKKKTTKTMEIKFDRKKRKKTQR
jgi:hypothetical protein